MHAKNNQLFVNLPIDDKQADVFRDKATIAIERGNWEHALENLKSAYAIRPQGAYIRLQLIKVLVQLKRFNEVNFHLDYLKNPPQYVETDPILKNLLNDLRSKIRLSKLSTSLIYQGLHNEAKKLSVEKWIELVAKSTEQETFLEGIPMPSTPPAEKQAIFNGSSGSTAIKLAVPVYKYVLQVCQKQSITPINTLLDFGCGWGRFTRLFVHDVKEAGLIGIDPWDEALQMCRKHMPYAAFVRSEFNPPLAFRDELFDVVFANSIFSHLSEVNALSWIKEIARILRPGGVLIATTHSKHWLVTVQKFQTGEKPCESNWHRGFKNSKIDFLKAIDSYTKGEFIFAPNGGVPNNTHYGDSFVPKQYIQKVWGEVLELVEFIDDPDRFLQATFTLKKQNNGTG